VGSSTGAAYGSAPPDAGPRCQRVARAGHPGRDRAPPSAYDAGYRAQQDRGSSSLGRRGEGPPRFRRGALPDLRGSGGPTGGDRRLPRWLGAAAASHLWRGRHREVGPPRRGDPPGPAGPPGLGPDVPVHRGHPGLFGRQEPPGGAVSGAGPTLRGDRGRGSDRLPGAVLGLPGAAHERRGEPAPNHLPRLPRPALGEPGSSGPGLAAHAVARRRAYAGLHQARGHPGHHGPPGGAGGDARADGARRRGGAAAAMARRGSPDAPARARAGSAGEV
jgi:hypothetical protein